MKCTSLSCCARRSHGRLQQDLAPLPRAVRRPPAAAAPSAVCPGSPYANATGIDSHGFDQRCGRRTTSSLGERRLDRRHRDSAGPHWWGVPPELRAESEARQRSIIEEMAARKDLGPDSVAHKIGAFFASLTTSPWSRARAPRRSPQTLGAIDAIDRCRCLAGLFGAAQHARTVAPIGVGVVQDPWRRDRYIAYLWQSGTRPARPRLLPARRREVHEDPCRLPALHREDAAARRLRRHDRNRRRPCSRSRSGWPSCTGPPKKTAT